MRKQKGIVTRLVVPIRYGLGSGDGRVQGKGFDKNNFKPLFSFRTCLHWQGLWFSFARHGEVIDAFIPVKKSKKGIRFGFVQFVNLEDAEKAIAQMNGSVLYGCRLTVSLARFWDNLEDRKNKQVKNRVSKNGESSKNQSKCIGEMSSDSRDSLKKPCLKRIMGHVEDEALRKLERCLIGTMATVCNTSQVEDRLQAWGLNDVTVKYMGGCRFLKDQELISRLQIQEWAILKETWTDLFHLPERRTWIQVIGVPPHCWNLTTFKRIVICNAFCLLADYDEEGWCCFGLGWENKAWELALGAASNGVDVVRLPSMGLDGHSSSHGQHESLAVSMDDPNDPAVQVFALVKDLVVGKTMPIYFPYIKDPTSFQFFPKEAIQHIPFSSEEVPEILRFFSFSPDSKQALAAIRQTLEICEKEPKENEARGCATTLESLADFARGILGSDRTPESKS
ncbi:hypothetical protein GQ457_17G003060 [Hibiscus cannabinus]